MQRTVRDIGDALEEVSLVATRFVIIMFMSRFIALQLHSEIGRKQRKEKIETKHKCFEWWTRRTQINAITHASAEL